MRLHNQPVLQGTGILKRLNTITLDLVTYEIILIVIHRDRVLGQAEDVRLLLFLVFVSISWLCDRLLLLLHFSGDAVFGCLFLGSLNVSHGHHIGCGCCAHLMARLDEIHRGLMGVSEDVARSIIMILISEDIVIYRCLTLIMHPNDV